MAGRIGGVVFIRFGDHQIEVEGSVESSFSNTAKETKVGPNGPVGYTETGQVPYVSVSAAFDSSLDTEALEAETDAVVTVEFANGKVGVLTGAYLVGNVTIDAINGTAPLRFEGATGELR